MFKRVSLHIAVRALAYPVPNETLNHPMIFGKKQCSVISAVARDNDSPDVDIIRGVTFDTFEYSRLHSFEVFRMFETFNFDKNSIPMRKKIT